MNASGDVLVAGYTSSGDFPATAGGVQGTLAGAEDAFIAKLTPSLRLDDSLPPFTTTAVEFHHAAFGHYFVTAQADEIAGLDSGVFAGWARTGHTFNVWTDGVGLADVCRFFTLAFSPKSSHFYTASASECDYVKQNPDWIYEKTAFKVALPDAQGTCPTGIPLYRLYNDGQTGAPNHRYTTSAGVRAAMISQGYLPEDDNTVCVSR